MQQLENPSYRGASLRVSAPATEPHVIKKFVHLTGKIINYKKNRHPKPKENYTHTKKTSITMLSAKLITPLFCLDSGLLFDRRQYQVKALFLKNASTYQHKWIGDEISVNNYKTSMQGINQTSENRFRDKIQTSHTMNEVLAKLNKETLRAVLIQKNTIEERLQAIQRRDEIKSRLSIHLPILFYAPNQALKNYTQKQQEIDLHNAQESRPRGNRLHGR